MEIAQAILQGDILTTTAVFLIRKAQAIVCQGKENGGIAHGTLTHQINRSGIGSEMKPPIIVTEPGDVMVFKSVREAEVCLEAPDVKEGRFKAYDSEGHFLSVEQESAPDLKLLGIALVDPGVVKIGREESATTHEDELRHLLVKYLIATGVDQKSLEGATLENVLEQVIKRQGFTK